MEKYGASRKIRVANFGETSRREKLLLWVIGGERDIFLLLNKFAITT